MKKLLLFLIFIPTLLHSQDINYARYIIDSLASPYLNGRGYAFDADKMAADFIANELKEYGLKYFNSSCFQDFELSTNVFAGEMSVKIDDKVLIPGVDFIINTKSPSVNGSFKIITLNNEIFSNPKKFKKFKKKDYNNFFIFVDTTGMDKKTFDELKNQVIDKNQLNAKGLITTAPGLTYVPSRTQGNYSQIIVKEGIINEALKTIDVKIDAQFKKNYKTQNVIGYIPGKVDSFIVVSAHYDHIGTMGKNIFFPGAHDNASGCAITLNLAKDFASQDSTPYYGLVFMFFSGEELGILGSKYYTENPVFPLNKIKFLLNLDLMGSGEEGIQIVNSTVFTKEYNLLNDLNNEYDLLPNIKKRGPAANSDHYFFYANGVPSYFVYSLGKYKEYHNINDSRENVPLSGYDQMYKLFKLFIINLR